MKRYLYLICGYGVPEDIATDGNYGSYLRLAFNAIYAEACGQRAVIVLCGGPTDCHKPYKRTEAGVMRDFFARHIESRPELRKATRKWSFVLEDTSLWLPESLLFAKRLLRQRKAAGTLTVFCEKTREYKVGYLAAGAFHGTAITPEIRAIDFDFSANRYLDPSFLKEKEELDMMRSRRALFDSAILKAQHDVRVKRLRFLRRRGAKHHPDAIREWWEREMDKIDRMF